MIYVDIPTMECVGNPDGAFKNVENFTTRAEAIKFCMEQFGADENGNLCLVSGDEESADDDSETARTLNSGKWNSSLALEG